MVHEADFRKKDKEKMIERSSTLAHTGLRNQEKRQKKTIDGHTCGRFVPGMRRCVMEHRQERLQPSPTLGCEGR